MTIENEKGPQAKDLEGISKKSDPFEVVVTEYVIDVIENEVKKDSEI